MLTVFSVAYVTGTITLLGSSVTLDAVKSFDASDIFPPLHFSGTDDSTAQKPIIVTDVWPDIRVPPLHLHVDSQEPPLNLKVSYAELISLDRSVILNSGLLTFKRPSHLFSVVPAGAPNFPNQLSATSVANQVGLQTDLTYRRHTKPITDLFSTTPTHLTSGAALDCITYDIPL